MFVELVIGLFVCFVAFLFYARSTRTVKSNKKLPSVAFVHLDLGVGGAERLIVDCACALQSVGHQVRVYTSNHPLDHCFPETIEQLKVEVHGNWIPHHISHKLQVVCSWIRMCYVAFKLSFFGPKFDVVICDGVSVCIPILKLSGSKILFYCHHPDLLLTRKKSVLRSLYRAPIDFMEEITTAAADQTLVNSNYTREIFKRTFKTIPSDPAILYPTVNIDAIDKLLKVDLSSLGIKKSKMALSLNRFDPAKEVERAINAFISNYEKSSDKSEMQLVIAGGYDEKVQLNFDYLKKLEGIVEKSVIGKHYAVTKGSELKKWNNEVPILFVKDVSEEQKFYLLKTALVLLYTPSNEHFGIVPVEAMASSCPIIATNSGGLKETVRNDEVCGLLCDDKQPNPMEKALSRVLQDPNWTKNLGNQGRQRAISEFSFNAMARNLSKIVCDLRK